MNQVSNPVEQSRQHRAAEKLLMLVGSHRRKDQRHAFVRGIALRQHVAEQHELRFLRQPRIGFAFVAPQLPAHGARGFAYDIDVYLPLGQLSGPCCRIGKALGGLVEMIGLAEFRTAQPHVVKHVDRENLVAQHVFVFADMVGGPQGERSDGEERGARHSQRQAHGARKITFMGDLTSGQPQQRAVDGHYQQHRRIDIAQQFARFARIGRQQIGEHVGGDDRVAEKIEQHDLEGAEKDERETQPDHHARTPERYAPHHVEPRRNQYQRLDRPDRILLGLGQHAVGYDQRDDKIDGQPYRETAACGAPPGAMLVAIGCHAVRMLR